MEAGGRFTKNNRPTGEVCHLASSRIIHVALDENGQLAPAPAMEPADDEEWAMIEGTGMRHQSMQKLEEQLAKPDVPDS